MTRPTRHPDGPTPQNILSSGALVTANSANGIAIFTGYDLRAGDIRSGKVTIANAGPLAGSFELSEVDATNSFAAGDLKMVIDDISGESPLPVYEGDIGGMPAAGIDLGDFEPHEARIYRFIVVLSLDSPHGGQGRGAGAAYEWNLVQIDDEQPASGSP